MTEIIYDQPQERGGRFAWFRKLMSDAGAGVVLGGEVDAGITPDEMRSHAAAPRESAIGSAALSGSSGYSEAEIQAMLDSTDPSLQLY